MPTTIFKNVQKISKEKSIPDEAIASTLGWTVDKLRASYIKNIIITPEQLKSLKTVLGVSSKELLRR